VRLELDVDHCPDRDRQDLAGAGFACGMDLAIARGSGDVLADVKIAAALDD
jgi:hypothetical protein